MNILSPAAELLEQGAYSFWSQRWSGSKLGWHLEDVNSHLKKHIAFLVPEKESSCEYKIEKDAAVTAQSGELIGNDDDAAWRVFVPLCGKSVDLAYLASLRGIAEVVGIDVVRDAAVTFADENPHLSIREIEGVNAALSEGDDRPPAFSRFAGEGFSMLIGDLFDMNSMDDAANKRYLGAPSPSFDAIYDRASLVAVAPALRENYAELMGKILLPGGTILLVTLDRRAGTEEAMTAGPPFSVDESEVRRLYESQAWVQSVTKLDETTEFRTEEDRERWAKRGVTELYELVFVIRAR